MRGFLLAAAVAFALVALPAAQAQANETLVIEAHDSSDECPEDRTYCFEVREGDLGDVSPGELVEITLRNEGQVEHELVLAPLEAADPDRADTEEGDAFAEIEEIGPDENATETVQIPDDVDGIYLWCDLPGHEELGMWTEQSFDTGEEENGSPGLGAVGALAVLLAAALVASREG